MPQTTKTFQRSWFVDGFLVDTKWHRKEEHGRRTKIRHSACTKNQIQSFGVYRSLSPITVLSANYETHENTAPQIVYPS